MTLVSELTAILDCLAVALVIPLNTPITEKAQSSYLPDSRDHGDLGTRQLTFLRSQLTSYKKWRTAGLNRKSVNWMKKATQVLCDCTNGIISKATMDAVRDTALRK